MRTCSSWVIVLLLVASAGCVLQFDTETTVGPFVRNVRVAGDSLEVERCQIDFSQTDFVAAAAVPGPADVNVYETSGSSKSISTGACVTEQVGSLAPDDDAASGDQEPEEGPL